MYEPRGLWSGHPAHSPPTWGLTHCRAPPSHSQYLKKIIISLLTCSCSSGRVVQCLQIPMCYFRNKDFQHCVHLFSFLIVCRMWRCVGGVGRRGAGAGRGGGGQHEPHHFPHSHYLLSASVGTPHWAGFIFLPCHHKL